ncbi:MAG: SDR family oxidoreductase, partial [Leptospiraceae bacterium]|nr:SDR family oxidoreductase [Leptospiraceae bacterium]
MKTFKNRVAIITGAASGIGLAIARNLCSKGCKLALSDINPTTLEVAKSELSHETEVHSSVLDVSDKNAWVDYTKEVISHFGKAHILVNNAGTVYFNTVEDTSIEDYEKMMNIHFGGVMYGTKNFLPYMQKEDEAHIVNLSSVAGLLGFPETSAYCAAKFAIRGFTESLRNEMSDTNVGVSSIHPGVVNTNILEATMTTNSSKQLFGFSFNGKSDIENLMSKAALTSAEKAAEMIVDGIKNNTARVLIGPDAM